ncbi:uncharacterized protein [Montipora capricornis]
MDSISAEAFQFLSGFLNDKDVSHCLDVLRVCISTAKRASNQIFAQSETVIELAYTRTQRQAKRQGVIKRFFHDNKEPIGFVTVKSITLIQAT